MKNPVCYYWKEPTTGVELHFTQDSEWGWCIGFPNTDFLEDSPDVMLRQAGVEIPWPELSPEEQKVIDDNYKRLHEMMGREDEI